MKNLDLQSMNFDFMTEQELIEKNGGGIIADFVAWARSYFEDCSCTRQAEPATPPTEAPTEDPYGYT